jgi:hypothetical protein
MALRNSLSSNRAISFLISQNSGLNPLNSQASLRRDISKLLNVFLNLPQEVQYAMMVTASISFLPLAKSLGNSAHYFQDPTKNSTYGIELIDPYNANFSNLILNFATTCNASIIETNFTFSTDPKTCEDIGGYEGGGPFILFGANICRKTIDLAHPFFEECLDRLITDFFWRGGEAETSIERSDTAADYTKLLVCFLLVSCICLLSCDRMNNALRESINEERLALLSGSVHTNNSAEEKEMDSPTSYQSSSTRGPGFGNRSE